jgi:hypothetical protein
LLPRVVRVCYRVLTVTGQPGPQPGQQLVERPGLGVYGECVADHDLQRASSPYREAGTSCQRPPLRLRLLPRP